MTGSRRTNQDSLNGSDSGEEDDDKSPVRGRSGKDGLVVPENQKGGLSESNERKVDAQITALLDENSKASGA